MLRAVYLDHDGGLDDFVALLYLLRHHDRWASDPIYVSVRKGIHLQVTPGDNLTVRTCSFNFVEVSCLECSVTGNSHSV